METRKENSQITNIQYYRMIFTFLNHKNILILIALIILSFPVFAQSSQFTDRGMVRFIKLSSSISSR